MKLVLLLLISTLFVLVQTSSLRSIIQLLRELEVESDDYNYDCIRMEPLDIFKREVILHNLCQRPLKVTVESKLCEAREVHYSNSVVVQPGKWEVVSGFRDHLGVHVCNEISKVVNA